MKLLGGKLSLWAAAVAGTGLAVTVAITRAVQNPAAAPKDPQQQEKQQTGRNVKVPAWRFTTVSEGTADMRQFDVGAAKQDIAQRCQNLTPEAAYELFRKYSFHQLEHLAKQNAIKPEHSMKLAEFRRAMIEAALLDMNRSLDKGLTVGLLDSGNRDGGIGSDIDQTLMLMPKELAEKLGLTEAKLIELFNKKFEARWKFHAEHLGIETMNGKDFFPDWKQSHAIGWMVNEYNRVAGEKRSNKEAYHSEAMLKIQVEGRHRAVIEAHTRRMAELVAERERVDNETSRIQSETTLSQAQKAEQIEALKKNLIAMEAEAKRLSPWLETGWDFSKNPPEPKITWFEDPKDRVTLNADNLEKRLAFDGTWDNWVAAENHPHNRSKYLLRGTGEGIGLMRVGGETRMFTTPFDYEKMYKAGHHDLCELFVKNTYPGMAADAQAKIKKALDVAAKQRIQHGSKNTAYPPAEVWAEYIRDLPDSTRKTLPEAMLIEAAKSRWQIEARQIMLENMLRTVSEPARLLNGGITTGEFAEITARCPDATPKKLDAAVKQQFYNAFHDLISVDHAKELAGSPEAKAEVAGKRLPDMVDRLLQKIAATAPELRPHLEAIARDVALKRIADTPGLQKHRVTTQFYEFAVESMKTRFTGVNEVYRRAQELRDTEKFSSHEVVGRLMLEHGMNRVAGLSADALGSLGFSGKVNLLAPEPGGRFPALEIKFDDPKFSGKDLLCNMASLGNLDSVLQVIAVYQDQGGRAAAWQAVQEIVMNVPEFAVGGAVYETFKTRNPKSLFMVGTVFLIPGAGHAYLVISIYTTTVKIAGTMVMQNLTSGTADMAYQGYLGAGQGFTQDTASNRFSILAPVKITVLKNTLTPPDGQQYPEFVTGDIFDDNRALELDMREPGEDTAWMRKDHLLGSGPLWEQSFSRINENTNPRGAFEARRLSLFYHYEKSLEKLCREKNFAISDSDKALPILRDWCLKKVDDWIAGTGEYAGIIDGENEIIARKFTPQIRGQIAQRMASDILWSFAIVRRDEVPRGRASVEEGLRNVIKQERIRRTSFEANQSILALHEAYKHTPDPAMADATHVVLSLRKLEGRKPQPKVHLRARVMDLSRLKELPGYEEASANTESDNTDGRGTDAAKDFVECSVSVVADPEAFPPPYHYNTLWDVRPKGKSRLVTAKVKIFDSKNQMIGEASQEIGAIEDDKPAGDGPAVRFVDAGSYDKYFPVRRRHFLQLAEPGDLRKLPQFRDKPELFKRATGIAFYRQFDESQPDENLRCNPGKFRNGSRPTEPDAIYSSPATSKGDVQLIGRFWWVGADAYRPPDLGDNANLAGRPMDASDPRPPRSYAYSIIYYDGPAGEMHQPKPEQLSESPLSGWTHCEVVPLICFQNEKRETTLAEPGKRYFFAAGTEASTPRVWAGAFLRLDEALIIPKPENMLYWADMVPDGEIHYIYRCQRDGQDRYALGHGYPGAPETPEFNDGRHTAFQPPGTYPIDVSIRLGKHTASGHIDITRTADQAWKNAQDRLQWRIANLQRTISQVSPGGGVEGAPESALAHAHYDVAREYLGVADLKKAEEAAKQAVTWSQKAAALNNGSEKVNSDPYNLLAKIYYAADRPVEYLRARESELEILRRGKTGGGLTYALNRHWSDVAEEYFSMTGDHAVSRRYMEQSFATETNPTRRDQSYWWWEDPRKYLRSPADRVERVSVRELDPDPLVIWKK